MITGADVVACARSQIGVRWQHGAALKDVATDCKGLIQIVAIALGIYDARLIANDRDLMGYGRQPDPARLQAACERYMTRVTGPRQLGDVLLMRFEEDPQHFGILSALDPPYVIHAYAQVRKVAENRIDDLWASRIITAYRLPGVSA